MSSNPLTRLARKVGAPFLGYFDHRFAELQSQVATLKAPQTQGSLDEVVRETRANAETVASLAASIDRRMARLAGGDGELFRACQNGVYEDEAQNIMNLALSFEGPLAAQGLPMNNPLAVFMVGGVAALAGVNERIVEIPFAFAAASSLAPGSSVVDIGSCESTVALSFASMGHTTYAVDPRPYPFSHEHLVVVPCESSAFTPPGPIDLVIAISAIEHFGLGHYDGEETFIDNDADREALDQFRSWLAPGGRVVLTVPTGVATTSAFQRVYDRERLDKLVAGWNVDTEHHAQLIEPFEWQRCESIVTSGRGVAMLILS